MADRLADNLNEIMVGGSRGRATRRSISILGPFAP